MPPENGPDGIELLDYLSIAQQQRRESPLVHPLRQACRSQPLSCLSAGRDGGWQRLEDWAIAFVSVANPYRADSGLHRSVKIFAWRYSA